MNRIAFNNNIEYQIIKCSDIFFVIDTATNKIARINGSVCETSIEDITYRLFNATDIGFEHKRINNLSDVILGTFSTKEEYIKLFGEYLF